MAQLSKILLLSGLLATACLLRAEQLAGIATWIDDGDSFVLTDDFGKTRHVRLWGIDAPEKDQPYGREALKRLIERIKNQPVTVEVVDTDRYGRTVGRVYCRGVDINLRQIEDGCAWWYRYHASNAIEFGKMEARAKLARRGLWALPDPVNPYDWRKQHPKKE